jgi:hypothetical protein
MEIISDTRFWTVIISLTSLLISLYPSIRAKIKGSKLSIEVNNTISLSHKYGLTNVQWPLTFINDGGTDVRIKKISIKLTRNDKQVVLPAQSYYRTSESSSPVMFSSIKLKPGEEISHNFVFFPLLDRQEERTIRALESRAKIETAPDHSLISAPKLVSPVTLSQLTEFYKRNFDLKHGDYQIELVIATSTPTKIPTYKFRFTIFEGDEDDLRSTTNGYVSGYGVCTPTTSTVWFNMPLST